MKVKNSLFRKIFIFSIAIVLFTVIIGYIFNLFFLDGFYIYRKKQNILLAKEVVKSKMNNLKDLDEYIENIKDEEGIETMIINTSSGKRKIQMPPPNNFKRESDSSSYSNLNNDGTTRMRRNNKMSKKEWDKNTFHIDGLPHTNIKILFYIESLSPEKTLVLTTSLNVMKSHKHEMNIFNVITSIISILLSMIISRAFSKKISKNIEKLNSVARKISVLDFSEKTNIHSEDEIGELSKSVDIMSENLSKSIENLKAFTSNASHELRTPITVLSANAQALLSGIAKTDEEKTKYYRSIAKKSKEMAEIVENLLTISRLSSPGVKINYENIYIQKLIDESIEKYETLELQKDIDFDVKLNNKSIKCDPKLFQIAINNIIQNALKYSKEESIISIYINNDQLCIENEIAGTPPNKSEDLWEPFSRGINATDNSIEGNGLGLSIVKKIVELNGYTCNYEINGNLYIFSIDISRS